MNTPINWLIASVFLYACFLWFHWRIIEKSGLPRALILLFVIPQLAIVGWGVMAFIDWPPKASGKVKIYGRK